MPPPSRARPLAPLALVVFVLAFIVILATAGGGHHARKRAAPTPAIVGKSGKPKRCYRVKSGELLSSIAGKTKLTVQQLQTLNPGLDPQALRAGQLIRILPGHGCGSKSAPTTTTASPTG